MLYLFLSISEASKVHPDSVEGLMLISNGYSDFPKEILRFKNLKYLEIGSYMWYMVLDSLTESQKKENYELKSKLPDKLEVMKYYKPNCIKSIPKEIKSLKKLELVDFSNAYIKSERKFKKIYKYLPKAEVLPHESFFTKN